jgi:tRNA-splicing ligase RtcB
MRVPVIVYGSKSLVAAMDDKVLEQARHVAALPGIAVASHVLPDAHWGYGFPVGGVAAFDRARGGVVSAGGVGFDISCGVRMMLTGLHRNEVVPSLRRLAGDLAREIPAGVGSKGGIALGRLEMNEMLSNGASWAVAAGYGTGEDLRRIEDRGCVPGADPSCVSDRAKERQAEEMGTLGSGNHYLEVQEVVGIHDEEVARGFGLTLGAVVVTIHCGSRGLGHQVGGEYMREMVAEAERWGVPPADRELAYAPLDSELGRRYLGAMRAAANCALANRQILGHLLRRVFAGCFPGLRMELLYDVSHNTCREEEHEVPGEGRRMLHVHRKGATRALGPGHPELPGELRSFGQPVLVGGSMGTCSHVLAGMRGDGRAAFSSAVHGAGRALSRHQALKRWYGRQIIDDLAGRGILVRSPSSRGVAEEAPAAYKDVDEVVESAERAGLARRVAVVRPLICIKG